MNLLHRRRAVSRKIIFSDTLKNDILNFISNTHQCTSSDVCKHFSISRQVLFNNFDKNVLDKILFRGCKDSTKEKLRAFNLGKKQDPDVVKRRTEGTQKSLSLKTPEEKQEIYKKAQNTKYSRYGGKENYDKHQREASRYTKMVRYGDENYNNHDKSCETKKKLYGNENYNNKDKIRKTQYDKYGKFAFKDKTKVERTMMLRYGVKHNWSSNDNKLNGRETMYKNAGSKEQHYKNTLEKGRRTRLELYGDEFYSNTEQAQKTMLERYGVPFYCVTKDCQDKSRTPEANAKKIKTKHINNSFATSQPEAALKNWLEDRFGKSDVLTNYQDNRYSNKDGYCFKCDFYIKSKDLFIELNLHPTHYLHPFDESSADDLSVLEKLRQNPTKWNLTTIDVWTVRDVNKLKIARSSGLNYLCFYQGDDYYDILQRI